ncbi:hypothetical protein JF546_19060 [Nitratireductor aquimarinus]|uniref:hypothetical protein n=1 Tax=Nitratireductor TaxID=245876 RepID=UPI001A8FA9B4|nr:MULTISPECIES: hypothetical protein [Nitratireductor]MBN8245122.1 hypothetical protein [Nitratireductor aquimarinus]MBY6133507.1 hypothetical protein [Nitratireductor aquimarinus]MCA1304842.1 hypothetical protein [Nitratireductor aquimarinus]MCV0350222.1 hypothetical protein [Nitratireductor sp.]
MNAVEAFRAVHNAEGDLKTDIKDLITDLLHLARRECCVNDVGSLASLAAQIHDVEVEEDPEE